MKRTPLLPVEEADRYVQDMPCPITERELGEFELSAISVDGKTRAHVKAKRGDVSFSPEATVDMLRAVGVPAGTVREYGDHDTLVEALIRHSYSKRVYKTVRLITIDGTVTRVESVENPSLSLHEVWPMVLRLPEVVGVEIIEQDRKGFQLRVVSSETMHPPKKVGDISHAGIFLSRMPEVIPFVKRLECNNGLMDYRRGKKVSVADKSKRRAEFLQDYEECLQEIYTCSKQTLEDFIRSVEEPLVNPSAYLSRIMREARIPATHQVALNEMLPQLPTTTNWFELANLVTSYAHNFSDPQEWQRFEALGGLVLEYSREAACSHCGRRTSGTPVHVHVH